MSGPGPLEHNFQNAIKWSTDGFVSALGLAPRSDYSGDTRLLKVLHKGGIACHTDLQSNFSEEIRANEQRLDNDQQRHQARKENDS